MMSEAVTYAEKLDAFLAVNGLSGNASAIEIFHAVRNIPYQSRGQRDPETVMDKNEGSCSGKHILLRDLLRHTNKVASVETVQGDFAATLPVLGNMPTELQNYAANGGIKDFHHYVVWQGPEGECKLDATWPDCIEALGVPGNSGWQGRGDSLLALKPEAVLARVEDVAAYKNGLIEGLSEDEKTNRARFLSLLSDWLAEIQVGEKAP